MKLLAAEELIKTGPVDHADWNYRPVLGAIQRARFKLMRRLFAGRHFRRLLEIGYGSGVFLPEAASHADRLWGIDIHAHNLTIMRALARHNCRATLLRGSASALPFADHSFDAVVAISSVEFVPDPERACADIARVLEPSGRFFLVTPGHSPLVDWGLKLLTGADAQRDYGARRQALALALRRHFVVQQERLLPRLGGRCIRLYTGLELRP